MIGFLKYKNIHIKYFSIVTFTVLFVLIKPPHCPAMSVEMAGNPMTAYDLAGLAVPFFGKTRK